MKNPPRLDAFVPGLDDAIDLSLRYSCGTRIVPFSENQLDAAFVRIEVDRNTVLAGLCVSLLKALEVSFCTLKIPVSAHFSGARDLMTRRLVSREKLLEETSQ
jgi:hypothetical protein